MYVHGVTHLDVGRHGVLALQNELAHGSEGGRSSVGPCVRVLLSMREAASVDLILQWHPEVRKLRRQSRRSLTWDASEEQMHTPAAW